MWLLYSTYIHVKESVLKKTLQSVKYIIIQALGATTQFFVSQAFDSLFQLWRILWGGTYWTLCWALISTRFPKIIPSTCWTPVNWFNDVDSLTKVEVWLHGRYISLFEAFSFHVSNSEKVRYNSNYFYLWHEWYTGLENVIWFPEKYCTFVDIFLWINRDSKKNINKSGINLWKSNNILEARIAFMS